MGGAEGAGIEVFLVLLITIAVVAAVVRIVRIPYSVALVLAGLVLAFLPDTPRFELTPEIILTIFLPVLLFYGAYHLELAELRANLTAISLLAIPGVVATAGMVGAALHFAAGLSWTDALLFGTIVAATDPVAVLTIFGELGAPRKLAAIVTGESLFNDGTALVFFTAMLGIATAHTIDAGRTVEQFAVAVVGGLALGVAVGILGTAVLGRIDDALHETTILLIMAYGGYLLAERLGASGPLETVAAGIFLGVSGKRAMSATTRLQAGATWEFFDFLANSLLFLLMGLALRPIALIAEMRLGIGFVWPLAVALAAVLLARPLIVGFVAFVLARRGQPLPRGWPTVISWAGLRGGVALAAALSLPLTLAGRDLLLTLTFGVVLFTLLAQGLTVRPLLERLGIVRPHTAQHDLELALGRKYALRAAIREVEALQEAETMDERLATRLLRIYREQSGEIERKLDTAYQSHDGLADEQERAALRLLLHVQHEAAREANARGQLSSATLRELIAQLDRDFERLESLLDQPQPPAPGDHAETLADL